MNLLFQTIKAGGLDNQNLVYIYRFLTKKTAGVRRARTRSPLVEPRTAAVSIAPMELCAHNGPPIIKAG